MKLANVKNYESTITQQDGAIFVYFIKTLFDKKLAYTNYNIDNENIEYKNIIDNLLPIKNNLQNNKDYLKCKTFYHQIECFITADMYNQFIAILNNPTEENVIKFCKICQ
jgi:hypothetical protein